MAVLIALCSTIFILFIIFDLFPIYRKKKWKEFWVYTILISIAYIIQLLFDLGVKIPSPAVPIKKLVSFIFGFLY